MRKSMLCATALVMTLGLALSSCSSPVHSSSNGPPAKSKWTEVSTTQVPVFYFQGMSQDDKGHYFFDGIDNGLFSTNTQFKQLGGKTPYIPAAVTKSDKYNHTGALAFDSKLGILLPMECYNTTTGVNCANTGGIGVVTPTTLKWKYEVKLTPKTNKKAMWVAVTTQGTYLWSSKTTEIMAYKATDFTKTHAFPGASPIKPVRTLKDAVPPSGITGGTFVNGSLYLAGTVTDQMQVWAINPVTGKRTLEITKNVVGEIEGIDYYVTGSGAVHSVQECKGSSCVGKTPNKTNSFGGSLHVMVMPIGESGKQPTYADPTILSYATGT